MDQFLEQLRQHRLIGIVRADSPESALGAVDAAVEAGLRILEVTFTVPDAPMVITTVRARHPGVLVGAGTLTSGRDVRDAVDAGSQFLVSPGTVDGLVEAMIASGVPALPGTLSPSDVMRARAAGAQAIKVFPAGVMGVEYMKALMGPFPDLQAVPTGGFGVDAIGAWLKAGAIAVGLGSQLFPAGDLRAEDWSSIATRVAAACAAVARVQDSQ